MQYTENLNLMKPDKDDKYLVDHMNSNSDSLDAAYKATRVYAESKSAEVLASAKSYAATQDEETLSTANGHADTKTSEALASAKAYADTKSKETLASAKSYSDGIKEKITSDLEATFIKKAITISTTGWEKVSNSDFYTLKIMDSDVTADTIVNINLELTGLSIAADCELQAVVISEDGFYNIYSVSIPSADMKGTVTFQKEVS